MLTIAVTNNHGSNVFTINPPGSQSQTDVNPAQTVEALIDEVGLAWVLTDIANYGDATFRLFDDEAKSVRRRGVVTTGTLTGTVNNLAPTGHADAGVIRMVPSGAVSLTGLAGADGEEKWLMNVSTGILDIVTLANASGSSDADKRFTCGVVAVGPNTGIRVWKDPTSHTWRVI